MYVNSLFQQTIHDSTLIVLEINPFQERSKKYVRPVQGQQGQQQQIYWCQVIKSLYSEPNCLAKKEINIFCAAVDLRDAFHITDTIFK